ncbi:alanine racemase (plasmid) [Rhizobium lusitanum]|uniref:alanine racemase n=1 Tax=Rhizobium lusitanum TaxID=293958 RepID=UPI001616345C|nr:alanine racemase [Rhizobium lusitanum]QND45942.1 alanine racemase [Rhizobium lusitanum]
MDGVVRMSPVPARQRQAGATGYLTIDLAAISRNYEAIAATVAPVKAAAVVKADAYGLGADRVAPALYRSGCRDFFVAQFGEAESVRQHLEADTRIYVLNGLQPGAEVACAEAGIIPVLNSMEQYKRWKSTALAQGRVLPAVLQFDTGMSRLGIPPEDRAAFATELAQSSAVEILFIMSHLASADELDNVQNAEQLAEMRKIAVEFPQFGVSFANSGGVFLGVDYHGILTRTGIAVYGGALTAGQSNSIQPVVRLDVAVVQTRTVPPGTLIGYGGTHAAKAEMRLATISAGYADGLPRCLGDRGAVFYDGVRLPIVGRVSMDSVTIDITALPPGTLTLGNLVEVIGPHQTLEDLAKSAGTISYEILTGLGHRYHRDYL